MPRHNPDAAARKEQERFDFTAKVVARLIELGHSVTGKVGNKTDPVPWPSIVDGMGTGYRIGAEFSWKPVRVSHHTDKKHGYSWRTVSRVTKRKSDGYVPVEEVVQGIITHVKVAAAERAERKAQFKCREQSDDIADRLIDEWLNKDAPTEFRSAVSVSGSDKADRVRVGINVGFYVDEDAAHRLLSLMKVFAINAAQTALGGE